MKEQFVVHGKTSINVDGDIIILESTGPWNAEYFYGLADDFKEILQHINKDNYAVLLIPIGETLGTPEAMESHLDFLRKGNTKAVAIIVEIAIPAPGISPLNNDEKNAQNFPTTGP